MCTFAPVSEDLIRKLINDAPPKRCALDWDTHVSKNDLLERNQSAYRQNHSTETALLHITNCLLESTDQGRVSILSLLDLSAAFDTIDHSILLKRLHMTFGISGSALLWLRSYIRDRFQVVVVNSISSTPQRLDFGVPQGSVLGPLLFVLYTQPISRTAVHQSGSDLHVFGRYTAFQFSTVGACAREWVWV